MNKIGVVLAAGGPRQNTHFFPSYQSCQAGAPHDLILVHRNMAHIENVDPKYILLNKVIDGKEIPHGAFGSYRFAYQTLAKEYDYFVFISDDVVLRRDFWLHDIFHALNQWSAIGFGGSQIFNGGKRYPHPSHVRAPLWFAKTECLSQAKWEFDSDHDGEMRIGDQLTKVGYVGVQVGNKINLGYDCDETDHITQILEKKFFPNKNLREKFLPNEDPFPALACVEKKDDFMIQSPYPHIGYQNFIVDIEPFEGLIYKPSLEIAKKCMIIKDYGNGTFCTDIKS